MTPRSLARLFLCLAVFGLTACASFDGEWRRGKQVRAADPFGGNWDGQWTSEKHRAKNGQPAGGRLRCVFTRIDPAHYRATFHANWLIFATNYSVTFDTKQQGGVLLFHGQQDLGAIFGGIYRYDGRVTPQHFSARFSSGFDRGEFEMNPAKN